jgi:hypothetical protein
MPMGSEAIVATANDGGRIDDQWLVRVTPVGGGARRWRGSSERGGLTYDLVLGIFESIAKRPGRQAGRV